jgi:hypothetical protein
MKLKLFFVLSLSLVGLTSKLQAQNLVEERKKGISEEPVPLRSSIEQRRFKQTFSSVQVSKYNNRDQEILDRLVTKTIPTDFPEFKSEFTNEQYSSLINNWFESHPSLQKKETTINQSK